MSCEVFTKINKDIASLEGIFSILKNAEVEVIDLSAKPSLDQNHYFVRLTLDSDTATVEKLFGKESISAAVQEGTIE